MQVVGREAAAHERHLAEQTCVRPVIQNDRRTVTAKLTTHTRQVRPVERSVEHLHPHHPTPPMVTSKSAWLAGRASQAAAFGSSNEWTSRSLAQRASPSRRNTVTRLILGIDSATASL
jgi:hypothetical protein